MTRVLMSPQLTLCAEFAWLSSSRGNGGWILLSAAETAAVCAVSSRDLDEGSLDEHSDTDATGTEAGIVVIFVRGKKRHY